MNVRRQRDSTQRSQIGLNGFVERDQSLGCAQVFFYRRHSSIGKLHLFADPKTFAAHQGFPAAFVHLFQQKQLDLATARLFACSQASEDDPAAVDHQQIARVQEFSEIMKMGVGECSREAIQDQQARSVARFDRFLGDLRLRKEVFEI